MKKIGYHLNQFIAFSASVGNLLVFAELHRLPARKRISRGVFQTFAIFPLFTVIGETGAQ